ncbi:MAG: Rossmann-like and DUF2520 domain-containing protein [Bacteroides sp.]
MSCVQSSLKSCSSDPSGDEIVLVGAGRVATQLGLALSRAGVSVQGVYSRNEEKASLLASRLASSVHCGVWEELLGQLPHRAVYLFCVSDDSILPLAEQWEALEGTIIHTSGSVPMPRLRNSRTGVFYPLQTFSLEREVDLSQTHFFVEGSDEGVVAMLTRWAKRLSGAEVVTLDSAQRQWLHLLGVLSNNFTNALLVEVQRLATEHELPFDALEPILTETLAKAFTLSPLQAQTGPARRGDQYTLAYHRELLAGAPRLLQLYDLFTALIQAQDAEP